MKLFGAFCFCLALNCHRADGAWPYSAVERGPWSGAITPTSAVVKAKLAKEGALSRLVVSKNYDLSQPFLSAAETSNAEHNRVVAFSLTGLEPDTIYYYAVGTGGRVVTEKRGRFRTFPAGRASFTFAFASCARTASSNPVFTTILKNNPLFFMNDGDFHYLDIATNSPARFRDAYDRVLDSTTQGELYRNIPFVYMWDDHDFGGNNSNRAARSHEAARLTYEEYVPHYPLPAGDGDVAIYQSFTVGRVRFILTDLRSERSPSEQVDDAQKTMMGVKQKAWFKQELLAANGKYPLIFWVSSVPWLGTAGVNYYPVATNQFGFIHQTNLASFHNPAPGRTNVVSHSQNEDHWSVYATERREIADFIKDNRIKGVCILHGDAHMLGADDGTHSDYATGGGASVPVLCAAPLDQHASIKGGPYSQGLYAPRRNEGCFGLVSVLDEGSRLKVAFSGRNYLNEEKISLRFEVPAR